MLLALFPDGQVVSVVHPALELELKVAIPAHEVCLEPCLLHLLQVLLQEQVQMGHYG